MLRPVRVVIEGLAGLAQLPHDEIIDVRSPSEFAEDHIPGAINLPVLDDAERAEVGTIYVQESPFRARKIGAALVAANIARHLRGPLADRQGGYRPLVYCWRGGQRSGAMASVLSQIGWRADTIEGGYRAYRRAVVRALYDTPCPVPVILLDGNTCTGKTELLAGLAAAGHQVIDLEGLARHRGSLFGAAAAAQPGQKGFEGAIALRLAAMTPDRPLIVEAESSRIGRLSIPPALWQAMRRAPRIRVVAPLPARAEHAARAYADIVSRKDALSAAIDALAPFHARSDISAWHDLASSRAWTDLAAALMLAHYDPAYERQRARQESGAAAQFELPDLAPATLAEAVPRLAGLVDEVFAGG